MITLDDLLAAGGRLHGAARATSFADFCYDSRLARPGELFLALRTPRADGHDYIADALEAGASGVLCAWPPAGAAGATVILADDPAALIQRWAARRLRAVAPAVVAVTGSVGKTSTVRAIAALLGQAAPAFRSRQSFNSLLGLPIALARLRDEQRFAVLECGADRFGEIARLAALFPPRIAVVTNVGAAHLDAFGTLDGVAREKGALVAALPVGGWAVLNGDDPRAARMRDRTAAGVLTFGLGDGCDLRASDIRYGLDGTRFRLRWNVPHPPAPSPIAGRGGAGFPLLPVVGEGVRGWRERAVEATIPLLGEPAVTIGLAAVGAALACGMSLEQAARGLALVALPARRRIAVLGEPEYAVGAAYEQIGTLAGAAASVLICKGDWGVEAAAAARRARPAIEATVAHTSAAVRDALPTDLGPGDLVLVKGSADSRMERVAADLLDRGVDAAQALVRQEPAWRMVRAGAPDRPTWLRIDLDAIAHNIRRLRALGGVPLMITLKADAYGHGAVRVARTALAAGAAALAVATLGEARTLRESGIATPILVLG